MATELIGRKIQNYRIDQLIGKGGMGTIYRAFDLNLNRTVAFKVIHPHLAENPAFKQRFVQEARAAAALDHPSIVKIYAFNADGDRLYMVMEYVDGGSLASYVRQLQRSGNQLPQHETLYLVSQVADALHYAHTLGIIHRDIKPDNILVKRLPHSDSPGAPPIRAIVTDFGLAKLKHEPGITGQGVFMGTMAYMSPEQCQGRDLDAPADVYSVGIMLYQLITGKLPFHVTTPAEAAHKHINEQPPAPSGIVPGIDNAIEKIILKAIAKQPHERYQTAAEIAAAMRNAMGSASIIHNPAAQSIMTLGTWQPDVSKPPQTYQDYSVSQDRKLILRMFRDDEEPQEFLLDREVIKIGRTPDNDITLPEDRVSRNHLEIRKTNGGFTLTDLGSSNGSWLDGQQLLAQQAQEWEPGRTLRIGSFNFQLIEKTPTISQLPKQIQTGFGAGSTPPIPTAMGSLTGSQMLSTTGEFTVDLPAPTLTVAPGTPGEMRVQLINKSDTVDHFQIEVRGVPKEWVVVPQNRVQLMPDNPADMPIRVAPPAGSEVRAGTYPYRLAVWKESNLAETAIISGSIIVTAVENFSFDMRPSRIKHGDQVRLTIQNAGNAPAEFTILGQDPAEAVYFQRQGQTVEVDAADESLAVLEVTAKRRPLIGKKQNLPFTIAVETENGLAKTANGQLAVSPVFPRWFLQAMTALIALAISAGVFNWRQNQQAIAAATATAIFQANASLTAEVVATTSEAVAAVSTQQQATAIAEKAQTTAEAAAEERDLQADSDGDGLTNEEEDYLGTGRNNPDSDGDGISDFDEVNLCTSPLVSDSDGDGLNDGDEARRGLLPCIPDTDGDGIPDGIDPDALVTPIIPTTTPLIFPTPVQNVIIIPTQPAPNIVVNVTTQTNVNVDNTVNNQVNSGSGSNAGSAGGGNAPAAGNAGAASESSSTSGGSGSSGGGAGVPTGANLLPNPSFEEGHFNQDGVSELQMPTGWRINFIDNGTFFKPETGVINAGRLPAEEVALFVWDGEHTLKLFKGGLPMSAEIYTDLNLQPGSYRLTVNVFPDIVVSYSGGKQFATDPAAGTVTLLGASPSDTLTVNYGQQNTLTHDFTVSSAGTIRVGASFEAIYNYANNGWFMDAFTLQKLQ